jgi:hypothetical protein
MTITVFLEMMMCSLVDKCQYLGGICYTIFSSTNGFLKMEAADSPETLIPIYHNKGYHTPEDWNLHIHCCEDLKSPYKIMML